jgi:hypothetical protein
VVPSDEKKVIAPILSTVMPEPWDFVLHMFVPDVQALGLSYHALYE